MKISPHCMAILCTPLWLEFEERLMVEVVRLQLSGRSLIITVGPELITPPCHANHNPHNRPHSSPMIMILGMKVNGYALAVSLLLINKRLLPPIHQEKGRK